MFVSRVINQVTKLTHTRKPANAFLCGGYTLIEILVVLFIISIVTSVALLTIGHNENRELAAFADELTQTMTLAEEQAMLEPTVLGLSFESSTYHFSSLQASGTDKPSWIPLHDRLIGEHAIPDNIQIALEMDGQAIKPEQDTSSKMPQVIVSTNGEMTPFSIYIGKRGQKPRYVVSSDADGNITNHELT